MLQQIMSGVMSGFSLYQTQKALMKAKEEAKNKPKNGEKDTNLDPSYGEMIKDNLVNGAAGLRDGLMEMEKMIPAIIGAIFGGNPNLN
ncbi:hypothetical protein II654_00745 [bacterium]|nr:hypothetical protein [bacterium]